ncbi:glycoside hydrolase N-terminal domain-containing protein [Sphingobacterium sp. HMA12]|uniref:glycoside hydrolase family 95 protein n=1 Tax=Sphingobacterium sp. HMA12 TaxID=2050894 RepID=UPI000CE9D1B5|nr:glycoside hydrolase family 95 protein [Sphingobacterium sp. HMA12]
MSHKINIGIILLAILSLPLAAVCQNSNPNLVLWYDHPATQWEEYVPLGNGKMGMMPNGGLLQEDITLNDITLWSGSPQDANNYRANEYLPEIRSLLLAGKNEIAQDLINKYFICTGPGSGGPQWGCFQTMGALNIKYDLDKNAKPNNYRRELDIQAAKASTSFVLDGIKYSREYFTSFNTDAGFIRLRADKPKSISIEISLNRAEKATYEVNGNQLVMLGQLDNGINGKGMKFITRVSTKVKGGTIAYEKDKIIITSADEVILQVVTDTDYKGNEYLANSEKHLRTALSTSWNGEFIEHRKKYATLFDRLSLSFGTFNQGEIPTDERLKNYQKEPGADPELSSLFFQYGRYLSISSTRVGLLPPNLQGLWANQIRTPWNGDYHLDVNVQMNHWHLGAANLSELDLPLADLVSGLIENGAKTAKAYYNAPGWVAHVITNIWGYTEPGEAASWGIANAGSGWLCNNLWNHFAYTQDLDYLKKIYPILRGAAQFYNAALMLHPTKKWLVTGPSVSPENAFFLPNGTHANVCMGPTIDNQITNELFRNLIKANDLLGLRDNFCDTLRAKLPQLPPVAQIAGDGRIMEWLEDYKETDPQHRHISHLYGVYPADQITINGTPEFANAAKKSLEVRGDDGPSWAIAYKMIFWAKLKDSERAYKLFRQLLTPRTDNQINYGAGGGSYLNLLTAGPPFQIDGNFGGTAAIAEMLVQNHENYIELLPSLPKDWSHKGYVHGIKAKGNVTIDLQWKDGHVTMIKLYSETKRTINVLYNGKMHKIKSIALQ